MEIFTLLSIIAGAVGTVKTIDAIDKNNKADRMNELAKTIVENAKYDLDVAQNTCKKTLEKLKTEQGFFLKNNVSLFKNLFAKIKNFDFEHNGNFGDVNFKEFSVDVLDKLSNSFEGAAALSLLGGGGAIALGAIGFAPVIFIAGFFMGGAAEEKLKDAKGNLAKARKYEADARAAIDLAEGINKVAEVIIFIWRKLGKHSFCALENFKNVIDNQGVDYSKYSQEAKEVVLVNFKLIQLAKVLLDTPILDKNGNLMGDIYSNLSDLYEQI